MGTTKEDILTTALRLFSQDGYEAVSVSSIAGELGMTKGALYKHYKNKRDIFNSIVEKMYKLDAERSQAYEVPEEEFSANASAYGDVSLESVRDFTIAQFEFWTRDDFASRFRKMLTLEQYRDPEMAELYSSCIAAGPVAYMADIFREMMARGLLREADPKQLAVEFYAPLYLLIHIADHADSDYEELIGLLSGHIDRFIRANRVGA